MKEAVCSPQVKPLLTALREEYKGEEAQLGFEGQDLAAFLESWLDKLRKKWEAEMMVRQERREGTEPEWYVKYHQGKWL